MSLPDYLRETPEGTFLEIHLQPRASRNEIVGAREGSLRVRLTAPPVEGEANKECIRYFSKILNVPKSNIEMVQGFKSRHKTLLIRGVGAAAVHRLLEPHGAA
jgi:uncharacterized protein